MALAVLPGAMAATRLKATMWIHCPANRAVACAPGCGVGECALRGLATQWRCGALRRSRRPLRAWPRRGRVRHGPELHAALGPAGEAESLPGLRACGSGRRRPDEQVDDVVALAID